MYARCIFSAVVAAVLLVWAITVDGGTASAHGEQGAVVIHTYTSVHSTPLPAADCARLRAEFPRIARDPAQACAVQTIQTVVVHSEPAGGPNVICGGSCGGGGCAPHSNWQISTEDVVKGPFQLWETIVSDNFSGNGCNALTEYGEHCYPYFAAPPYVISTEWCDTYDDSYGDGYASGGFRVSEFGVGFTENMLTEMYVSLTSWRFSNSPY
jgi:hypothetical protein